MFEANLMNKLNQEIQERNLCHSFEIKEEKINNHCVYSLMFNGIEIVKTTVFEPKILNSALYAYGLFNGSIEFYLKILAEK